MIKVIGFINPNTLEGNLQIFADDYPKEIMFAYKQSVLVGVPNNIVNTTHPNRKGEMFGISVEDLNEKYLKGEIIDYDKLNFLNINSAHCEIEYKFKKI